MKISKDLKENKKELTDSFYLVLMQGVNYCLPLIVMPYLLYILKPEGYGYVGYAFSFVQYFTLIVDFGFNLSGTKEISQATTTAQRDRIFWNILLAKGLLLLVSLACLLVLLAFVPTFQVYSLTILATVPMVIGTATTYMFFFQGIQKVRTFSIINTLSKIIWLPLIFLLIKNRRDYNLAAFLQSIVFVSTAILSNLYLYTRKYIHFHQPTLRGAWQEIKNSYPLFLSSAATSVYTQLFVVILGFYCTTTVIGLYTSADRIVRALVFLIYVPLNQVFYPKISKMAKTNRGSGIQAFYSARKIIIFTICMVCISIYILSPLLPDLLGKEYKGSVIFMEIMGIMPFFIAWGGIYGQMGLVALGNKDTIQRFRNVYILVAIIGILGTFIAAPLWSAIGVCSLEVVCELLVAVLMFHQVKKNKILC